MRFIPARGKVLVRHSFKPGQTKGGLHLPDKYRTRENEVVVLAVGADPLVLQPDGTVEVIPHGIEPGDRCLVQKYKGISLFVDGEEVGLMDWEEVLLMVREESDEEA